jgi:hypothetical protein
MRFLTLSAFVVLAACQQSDGSETATVPTGPLEVARQAVAATTIMPDFAQFDDVHLGPNGVVCGMVDFMEIDGLFGGLRAFAYETGQEPVIMPSPARLQEYITRAEANDLTAQLVLIELIDQQLAFSERYSSECDFAEEEAKPIGK